MLLFEPNVFLTFNMKSQQSYLCKITKDYYINVPYFKTIKFYVYFIFAATTTPTTTPTATPPTTPTTTPPPPTTTIKANSSMYRITQF
jgi:hypothetical protein